MSNPPAGNIAARSAPTAAAAPKKTEWTPRMWNGMNFFAWMRALVRNRFAVSPPHWHIALSITFISFFHTLLQQVQEVIYGRRIRDTVIDPPPIFIIGHWRTGTTLLHDFLSLDERHGYPTTYECLEPNHFLLTERLFTKFFNFFMPSRRPMDNVKVGWERPQEDEFALGMMGLPSPYLTIAFPNRPPQDHDVLFMENVRPGKLRAWKRGFVQFLKRLTYRTRKRLVLKSPPHSCRLEVLKEIFPDALFVHIVRDPYVIYPSTINLWKSLYRTHGLQTPKFKGLEEYVFNTYVKLYDRLEEGRKVIDPDKFHEMRYEDLVRDPVGQMRTLYERLKLGGFDKYQPRLEAYLATLKGYETNRYTLTPEQRAEITRRWGHVIERYGYGDGVVV
jgi:hypothetical protein